MTDTPLDLDAILANAEVGRATYLPHLDPLALRVIDRARKRAADDIPALVAALRKAEAEVASLRTLRLEIKHDLQEPSTIKVWWDNVLRFNGVDLSALLERDASRTAHAAMRDWLTTNAPTVLADFDRAISQEDQ